MQYAGHTAVGRPVAVLFVLEPAERVLVELLAVAVAVEIAATAVVSGGANAIVFAVAVAGVGVGVGFDWAAAVENSNLTCWDCSPSAHFDTAWDNQNSQPSPQASVESDTEKEFGTRYIVDRGGENMGGQVLLQQ